MTVSLFLHCSGQAIDPGGLLEAAAAGPGRALAAVEGATSVELYTPLPIADPMIDDGAGQPLVVQVRFATGGCTTISCSASRSRPPAKPTRRRPPSRSATWSATSGRPRTRRGSSTTIADTTRR